MQPAGSRPCGEQTLREVAVSEATVNRAPLVQVAEAIAPRVPQIVRELLDLLLHQVDELRGDELVIGRLRASIESNVSQLLHLMEQPVDLHLVEPPAGALQFAQQLAQRGVPLSALWRAYHLCNARFFIICLHELARPGDTAMELAEQATALSGLLNTYVDHVCDRIGTTYDIERERWFRQQDAVRTERLSELLAGRVGGTVEVEAALGYRLTGRHLAVILWDTAAPADVADLVRLQRLVTSYADRLGCREQPLVVPRDQSTVWAWLPLPARSAADHAATLEQLLCGAASTVRGALGDPGTAVKGFICTHRHAAVAKSVALAAGGVTSTVIPYTAVGGLSFLCQDLDRAREWIRETLGALADHDEAHARLRESVSAFLDTGGSLSAAAQRLGCHKNTVYHRIQRAEEELGRDVRERRVDVELALLACQWLGSAVLAGAARS